MTKHGHMRAIALGFLAFFLSLSPVLALREDGLAIRSGGKTHGFLVEIAQTPQEQQLGLMHRKTMAADHGMLFILEADRDIKMWMKNTPLSLDMLFIDRSGRVVYIAADTTPESTEVISAGRPVHAVLELRGGTVRAQHLKIGDSVIHPYFDVAP